MEDENQAMPGVVPGASQSEQPAPKPPKPAAKPKKTMLGVIPPTPAAASSGASQAVSERRFRVMADCKVPRPGGVFILRKDKVISDRGYDIAALRQAGAKLDEIQ